VGPVPRKQERKNTNKAEGRADIGFRNVGALLQINEWQMKSGRGKMRKSVVKSLEAGEKRIRVQ